MSAVDGAVPDERAQDLAEALHAVIDALLDGFPPEPGSDLDEAVARGRRLLASLTYDTAGSASRQNYIDTGVHFLAAELDEEEDNVDDAEPDDPCVVCRAEEAVDYGMCASCEHNARRSGWNPGDTE